MEFWAAVEGHCGLLLMIRTPTDSTTPSSDWRRRRTFEALLWFFAFLWISPLYICCLFSVNRDAWIFIAIRNVIVPLDLSVIRDCIMVGCNNSTHEVGLMRHEVRTMSVNVPLDLSVIGDRIMGCCNNPPNHYDKLHTRSGA